MDLNHEYAAHQKALMRAGAADSLEERLTSLDLATRIAERIAETQFMLGAAAACAWTKAHASILKAN